MLDATLATYGAPYANAEVVDNPNTQCDADLFNRQSEDVAQLTRTGYRAIVKFTPVAGAPFTLAAADVQVRTMWGDGTAYKPTVAKTGNGLYTITFAASYTDGLAESESLGFLYAHASLIGATIAPPPLITSLTANVVGLTVLSSAFAASDLAGANAAVVWIR